MCVLLNCYDRDNTNIVMIDKHTNIEICNERIMLSVITFSHHFESDYSPINIVPRTKSSEIDGDITVLLSGVLRLNTLSTAASRLSEANF